MKKFTINLLAAALMVVSANALEQRTFHNADKSKSFDGTLTGYDIKKQRVSVLSSSGKTKSFPMSMLSEECQKYVLSKKDLLAIARYVKVDFKEVKADSNTTIGSIDRKTTTPTHYAIEVYNRGEESIADVELKYTLYYKQGNLNKGGTDARTSSGSLSTGKIYDHDAVTVNTQKIDIVRTVKKAQGGG